jgi:NitT/TauT family transport system permease protein
VVLAPIFTLWFGLGIWSKVALGVALVFFIVFLNVYQDVKEVSPTVLANARMLGMNDRALMRHVYWPSALSWMFSSLHTSVGFAVVGAVVGEYLGSAAGLGYLIQQAEGIFDVAGVFAGMFILAAFVLAIDGAVTVVERRLLVWRPDGAETQGDGHNGVQGERPCISRPGWNAQKPLQDGHIVHRSVAGADARVGCTATQKTLPGAALEVHE